MRLLTVTFYPRILTRRFLFVIILGIAVIIAHNLILPYFSSCCLLELNEEILYFLNNGNIWMVVQSSKGLLQILLNTSSTKRREFQIFLHFAVVRYSTEGTVGYLLD